MGKSAPGGGTLLVPWPVGVWTLVLARGRVSSKAPRLIQETLAPSLPWLCDLSLLKTTLTADTDSEEEEEFLKDEWAAQGPSSSKLTHSLLCGMVGLGTAQLGASLREVLAPHQQLQDRGYWRGEETE